MTARCFVAGSPIAHSRSPLIHGYWIAERSLDATYERIETTPETLGALLGRVRTGEFRGGNLTVPLKEAALPLLDRITPEAEAMGAVNTVMMRDGALLGANTDVPGFFAHLDHAAAGWDAQPRPAVVLGAGGAARAIVYGLMRRNVASITIANRSPDRAKLLAAQLAQPQAPPLEVAAWPPQPELLEGAGLIVQTTSLGMKGQPELEMAWPGALAGIVACDIVYAPLETSFLAEAARRGAVCVDGLGMLLHQAALAFGLWFGDTPTVSAALRAKITRDLQPQTGI